MKAVKKSDGWYVTGIPECEDIGPYDKDTALDHVRRLENFYKYKDTPGYITCDKKAKK